MQFRTIRSVCHTRTYLVDDTELFILPESVESRPIYYQSLFRKLIYAKGLEYRLPEPARTWSDADLQESLDWDGERDRPTDNLLEVCEVVHRLVVPGCPKGYAAQKQQNHQTFPKES